MLSTVYIPIVFNYLMIKLNFLMSGFLKIMRRHYFLRSDHSKNSLDVMGLNVPKTVSNILIFPRCYSSLQYATSTYSNTSNIASKLPLLCDALNTSVVPRREAGHSHFANIKHTKASMDQTKAVNIQRHFGLIRLAIRGTF